MGHVEIRKTDKPLPERKPARPRRIEVYEALEAMAVGDSIEVSRNVKSTEQYIYRFRRDKGRDVRFKIRPSGKLGWTDVWRVA